MNGNEQIIRLLTEMKESLEREIHDLTQHVDQGFASVTTRFDAQAARLDRHAGLWQTGSRWSSRMDAWAEKVDANAEAVASELAALRQTVRDLQKRLDELRP